MDEITLKFTDDRLWKLLQRIVGLMLKGPIDYTDPVLGKVTWVQVAEFLTEQGFNVSINVVTSELTTTEQDLVAMRLKWC